MAVHPPAMGGKTAWGVSEVVSRPTDDPKDIIKMRKLQADFSEREQERLNRLKQMDNEASGILESRKARRLEYQPPSTNNEEFKKNQDEILRKMLEAKERRRTERRQKRKGDGLPKRERAKRGRKRDRAEAEAEASSSSSASSSASSSSPPAAAPAPAGLTPEQEAQRRLEGLEARQRAEEAKGRERELRKRAREEAKGWAAEARRREAEQEQQRQQEQKRRAEEAEQRRREEARKRQEELERKRREEQPQKAPDESKRKLFQVERRKTADGQAARRETVAGGFYKGQRVLAVQDITVRGQLVVKAGAVGSVVGPSDSDPAARIAVRFLQREDVGLGNLNVVPREIKKG